MKDHAVLITGASTGIGACCALYLDKLGFRVFAGVRTDSDAANLERESSNNLRTVRLDVTKPETLQATARLIENQLAQGALALHLVNNAGLVVPGPLEYLPLEALRQQFEVNVFGQIAVTQALLPLIRKYSGRVVMMSSIAGRNALPFVGAYSASKFALESLSDSLRLELSTAGIGVSIIEPGSIRTPIWEKARHKADTLAEKLPGEAHERYGKIYEAVMASARRSEARGIAPEAVAKAVHHALSAAKPKTRYVVGRDAEFRMWLRWLPDTVVDWLIRKKLKM